MKKSGKAKKIAAAVIIIACVILFLIFLSLAGKLGLSEPAHYETGRFSNMCAYEGQVYRGVNGIYGTPLTQQTSIFTIQDGKVYYVEKVTEAFESMTDEQLPLYRENMDGSGKELLTEDVFLAGAGHEALIGDKLFYAYAYDDNYQLRYAYCDTKTGNTYKISSDRIGQILGYDGNYLYYSGYDSAREENILGRILLKRDKDETLAAYAPVDEEGYVENTVFHNGSFYCLTLAKKSEGYDYRTYQYEIQIRDGQSGKVTGKIQASLTGSSNYSFFLTENEVFYSAGGKIWAVAIDGTGNERVVAQMKEKEYWGILYFTPGDGFLYYEAIAETDEETGNNDYFYRVPVEGGEPELLKAWFTV